MNDQAPKVTRARMIIEMSDGSARYYEARDPAEVGFEISYRDIPRSLDSLSPLELESVSLSIEGAPPFRVKVFPSSGEIPPELAERAVDQIDASTVVPGGGTLQELRPYLARIAGRQP